MKRKTAKTEQLQLRVTPFQKRAIRRQAQRARLGMSEWILSRILPSAQLTFQGLAEELARSEAPSYAFAELLDWLGPLDAAEFEAAVSEAPAVPLAPYWQNYLAATVEQAAAVKGAALPGWTREVAPLPEPVFGSSLASLRLHLLVSSPPAFAARNLFVSASVGDRV